MTPKEKAEELFHKYEKLGKDFTKGVSMNEFSKQCALISVDNVIDIIIDDDKQILEYWEEVKEEIKKL